MMMVMGSFFSRNFPSKKNCNGQQETHLQMLDFQCNSLVFQTFSTKINTTPSKYQKTFGSSTLGLSGERMSTVLSEKTHREINFDKTSFLPMYMVTTKKNVRSNYVKSTRQNMFQKNRWGSPNDSVACCQPRWQGMLDMLDTLIPKSNICATQTHDSACDRCSIPGWNPKIFVHPRFCTPRHTNDRENYNCYVNQEENHLGAQHPKKGPTILTLPKLNYLIWTVSSNLPSPFSLITGQHECKTFLITKICTFLCPEHYPLPHILVHRSPKSPGRSSHRFVNPTHHTNTLQTHRHGMRVQPTQLAILLDDVLVYYWERKKKVPHVAATPPLCRFSSLQALLKEISWVGSMSSWVAMKLCKHIRN